MRLYYRISDPDDLRDLDELMSEWLAASNPKAAEWALAPPQPDPSAYWSHGAWAVPPPTYRYAATQSGWVVGVTLLHHQPPMEWEQIAASPRVLVACGDEVQVGWRYADGAFTP